ncbi:MAG TPA: hypothetical protein VFZ78_01770 [Flavisolibacter sp.]
MKKAILSLLFIGASYAIFAQVDTSTSTMNNTSATLTTTANYQAFGTQITAPTYVETYFIRDYPTATEVMWWEAGDWYHATYNNNGRYNHVYYNTNGSTFTVALPVTQNYVPDDVINKAGSMYGPMIYDITTMHWKDDADIYQVRLLQNGTLVSEWIDANGNKIADPFVTHTTTVDTMSPNTLQPVDKNTEIKIKTENADGTETKTKIKDGKVKTKTDD